MLHFLRKIRLNLLANKQFFKYLKYAIGEIVLVVVGILIALYINNENEKRKEQERFNQILAEIEKELEFNIGMSRYHIGVFSTMDLDYQKLLIDSLKFDDYSKFMIIMHQNREWPARDDAFKKLDLNINLSKKQDSVVEALKWLYGIYHPALKLLERDLLEQHRKSLEKFERYDWYTSWKFFDLDDERIIQFFRNDPEYLKIEVQNFGKMSRFRAGMQTYELRAFEVYKILFEYLNSINYAHSDSLKFTFDPNEFKHYIGKYRSKWTPYTNYVHDDSIVISLEENKLIWTGFRSVSPGTTKTEIIPIDKYSFRDDRGPGIYHIEFDDKGDVTGIRYSEGPNFILKTEKVR